MAHGALHPARRTYVPYPYVARESPVHQESHWCVSHALLPARAMMRPTHLVVLDDRSAVISHQDLRAAARPQNVLAYYSMRLCAGF